MNVSLVTRVLPVALTLAAGTAVSDAAVVLDTFAGPAPGHTATGAESWAVSSAQWVARSFTLASDHTLDSVTVPMFWGNGSVTPVSLSIQADVAGSPSGSPLESFTLNNPGAADGTYLITSPSGTNVSLSAGTYYIVASSVDAASNIGWAQTNDGHSAPLRASFDSGASWASFDVADVAVRVEASPVPEPGVMIAFVGGVALTALRRRR